MKDALRLVFWELTARCNLTCKHCRAEAQDHFVAGELTTSEIVAVAEEIRKVDDPIMILTGGEPLVREDFFEIARACAGMFARVAVATNGTLVDEAMAREIAASGIQRASVSIDGATAATHDEFRGLPGSFDDALNGMAALLGADVPVQVNVTVARHNMSEIDAILQLAIERGADAFHVFVLVPVGCGVELSEELRLTSAEMESVLRWLFDKSLELRGRVHIKATCAPQYYRIMHEVSRERGIDGSCHRGHAPCDLVSQEGEIGERSLALSPQSSAPATQGRRGRGMHAMTRGCLAGSAVCFISRVGDVQPCGYLPLQVGNVREQAFGDIWNGSEVFAALRDPARLQGKCGACGYRRLCMGCRARAFSDTGGYLAEDPDCAYVPPLRQGADRS